jgi:peptidylprolyl isomerase
MAARDVDGLAELVCADEQAQFRESISFLRRAREGPTVELEEFRARTERSDGTSATLIVRGRFLAGELGRTSVSATVRVVREGAEWCITGERDGFRSIEGSVIDVYSLMVSDGMSRGLWPESRPGEWIEAEANVVDSFLGYERASESPPRTNGVVVTTASGLQYIESRAGIGPMPQPGQTLAVHYTLWLEESGKRIDTSRDGAPLEFVLGGGEVVDGFDEGLATMRKGGERVLIVPPKLGYGRDDDYGDIPINSTLIFDVELVEIR